jgi:hypothetical protein
LSFDRAGRRELIVADVGQEKWEEINIIVNGGNYGWRVREGFEPFVVPPPRGAAPSNPADAKAAPAPTTGPDGKPFIDPVYVYKTRRGNPTDPDAFGVTITGGYVYRGKALPHLTGRYVFGDWSKSMMMGDGTLLVATRPEDSKQKWTAKPLVLKGQPDGKVKAFLWALGEDEEGELYVMTNGANMISGTRGKLYKLVAP